MLPAGAFPLHIHAGVIRFDEQGALFIHLPHSEEAPCVVEAQPMGRRFSIPLTTQNLDMFGNGAGRQLSVVLPAIDDLPEGGLVMKLRDFTSASREADGSLYVLIEQTQNRPTWFTSGQALHFGQPGGDVRLWRGSALPEGVRLGSPAGSSDPSSGASDPSQGSPTRARFTDPGGEASRSGCAALLLLAPLLGLLAWWL